MKNISLKHWPLIWVFTLSMNSCGFQQKNKSQRPKGLPGNLELGITTSDSLKSNLGDPLLTYHPIKSEESTIYSYEGNQSFKIEKNTLKAFFRDPEENEKHLQYWLHLWKDKQTTTEKILESKNAHGQYDYQMICLEEKTTIIFENESGNVKRVMYYENE